MYAEKIFFLIVLKIPKFFFSLIKFTWQLGFFANFFVVMWRREIVYGFHCSNLSKNKRLWGKFFGGSKLLFWTFYSIQSFPLIFLKSDEAITPKAQVEGSLLQ